LFSYLMNSIYAYTYMQMYVDITPQLITLNQRSKSNKYHKNKHSNIQIPIKIVLFFVPKSRSPIPKVTLGTGFQSVKSTFVFRRIIRVEQK
jgi:hypothetical protein